MAIPVTFDTFSWPTKTAAKAAYKEVLNDSGYGIGDRITNPVHEAMLYEALDRHPDSVEKTGNGVEYFYVGRTDQDKAAFVGRNARGIWIRREDGTEADFSYNTAIDGRSTKTDAKEAMRLAVLDIRLRHREDAYDGGAVATSFISGHPIPVRADAHTIYASPEWSQLTYRFAETQGGWGNIEVTSGSGDAQVGGRFADPAVEQQWIDFHNAHANMVFATASESAQRPRARETDWTP